MARYGRSFPIKAHYRRTMVGFAQQPSLSDTLTLSDTILRADTRSLLESVLSADAPMSSLLGHFAVIGEIVITSATMLRDATRSALETVTSTDVFSRTWVALRTYAESLSITTDIDDAITAGYEEIVTLIDTALKYLNGVLVVWGYQPKSSEGTWNNGAKSPEGSWDSQNKSNP